MILDNRNPWTSAPPRARAEFTKMVIAAHSGICHICGHPGARQADHLESVTDRPDLAWKLSNCKPAHGAPGNRCRVCKANCNQLRGGYSVERARRIISEKTGRENPPAARKSPESGREF